MKKRLPQLKPGLVTAIAAMSLAACAGGVNVSHKNVAHSYEAKALQAVATGDNELRTVIVGDPFGTPKDAFDKAVLASLQDRSVKPRLNLSTDPKREDARKHHLVLAFNPTNKSQADALCSGRVDSAKVADTGGRLTVAGAYCVGDKFLTQAAARSDDVTGTESKKFQSLMAQLAKALFPAENPQNCILARQVRLCS